VVFDTNILLDTANRDSPFHEICQRRLFRGRSNGAPAFLPWSVCYEFLREATHTHGLPSPWTTEGALGFLNDLMASSGFEPLAATSRHASVLEQTLRELPDLRDSVMHDVHIAVLMREHGISRICTRDRGFRRFPFLTVVDSTEDILW